MFWRKCRRRRTLAAMRPVKLLVAERLQATWLACGRRDRSPPSTPQASQRHGLSWCSSAGAAFVFHALRHFLYHGACRLPPDVFPKPIFSPSGQVCRLVCRLAPMALGCKTKDGRYAPHTVQIWPRRCASTGGSAKCCSTASTTASNSMPRAGAATKSVLDAERWFRPILPNSGLDRPLAAVAPHV